jgi:membrane protease YdiL (CAAX protease family)
MQENLPAAPEAIPPVAGASSVRWSGIALYVALACAISWAIWLGLGALGVPLVIRAALGMFGPAIAASLVRGPLRREGFADAGLRLVAPDRPGGGWMYLAAYLLPPLLIAAGIGLSLLIGYQHWMDPVAALERIVASPPVPPGAPHPPPLPLQARHQLALITLLSQLVLAFTLGIAFNMIFTFGEELGWRGYLLVRLAPLGGGWAALLSGLIWGLWHAPIIVTASINYPGHPWLGALSMVLVTTAFGFVLAWLRFRSGSIWPSTLAHAAANAQVGFTLLVLAPAGGSLLRPAYGLIGVVPIAVVALVLLLTGRLHLALAPSTAGAAQHVDPDRACTVT